MFGFTPLEVKTYLVLTVCGGLQIFINQIEQPYARSLIVCDKPIEQIDGVEPSGSAHCGDRLYVIGEGARLSGSGESLESIGRFLITLFVSGFADSHGRKAAAVLGWGLITTSVVAFCMASFIKPWAKVLFIVAQGLQGMSGIGLVLEIVTRDIAHAFEGETTAFYARKNSFGMCMGMFFFAMIMLVQHSQITEFQLVWGIVLIASIVALLALIFIFPETQAEELRQRKKRNSVKEIIREELSVYWRILKFSPFVKLSLIEAMFSTASGGFMTVWNPWVMATFGFNQFQVMIMILPTIFLGMMFQPLVANFCKKWGHRKVFLSMYWFDRAQEVAFFPFLTKSVAGWPLPVLFNYLKTPMSGAGTLHESLSVKLVKKEESSKYAAMSQLNAFFTGSVSALLYSRVFDAEATTFMGQVSPFALSISFRFCCVIVYFYGWGAQVLQACDELTADAEKETEKRELDEKMEHDKKNE